MLTALQAKAAIVLFESGRAKRAGVIDPLFDSADIAEILCVTEAEICNLLAAEREVVRELFTHMTEAANAG